MEPYLEMPKTNIPAEDQRLALAVPLKFLTADDLAKLLEASTVVELEKEERLIAKGRIPEFLYIPIDPHLREVVLDVEEGEQIEAYSPVGMDKMLRNQPFSVQVVAAEAMEGTDVVVSALPFYLIAAARPTAGRG